MEDEAKASRLRAEQALAEAQQAAEWKAKGWREQDEERMRDPVYQAYETRRREEEDRRREAKEKEEKLAKEAAEDARIAAAKQQEEIRLIESRAEGERRRLAKSRQAGEKAEEIAKRWRESQGTTGSASAAGKPEPEGRGPTTSRSSRGPLEGRAGRIVPT